MNIESVIFYVLLIDALGANVLAWTQGQKWWQRNCSFIARHFPLSRGWVVYYLVLVCILGIALYRYNALVLPW